MQIGLSRIPAKYIEELELRDMIIGVSDDLWHDCWINKYCEELDPVWEQKYINLGDGLV